MARENDYIRRRRTTVNVQADWNATDGDAFIKNKPSSGGIGSISTTSSLTINMTTYRHYRITALASALTINAPLNPVDGYTLLLEIEDDGTTRALTWNAVFSDVYSGASLPNDTTAGKNHILLFVYNSTKAKWELFAADEES